MGVSGGIGVGKNFIDSLELKLKAKAFRTISLLSDLGHLLKEPHSKKVVGYKGLYELRVSQGNNICSIGIQKLYLS
jgi:hypothetical protein